MLADPYLDSYITVQEKLQHTINHYLRFIRKQFKLSVFKDLGNMC